MIGYEILGHEIRNLINSVMCLLYDKKVITKEEYDNFFHSIYNDNIDLGSILSLLRNLSTAISTISDDE